MRIREVLVSAFRDRFPDVRCAVTDDSNWELRIEAPNPAIGFVSIADEGHEATVAIGEMTHSHFNPYDSSPSEEARAKWMSDAVLAFLEATSAECLANIHRRNEEKPPGVYWGHVADELFHAVNPYFTPPTPAEWFHVVPRALHSSGRSTT